jgi:RimJ/RimL family protein N-acetyltransferase
MLSSPRLRLRSWRDEDILAFAALNADPEVIEHMPKCLTREESDAFAGRTLLIIRVFLKGVGSGLMCCIG